MEAFASTSGFPAWLVLGFGSALLLGLYDIAKKRSLDGNAVTAVLLLCNLFTFLGVLLMWRVAFPSETLPDLGPRDHAMLAGKAGIVTASWLCTFRAIKRLPISISAPIRASAPLFTLAGAVFLLGERPGPAQWGGIAAALLGYWSFSLAGRTEGIDFRRDRWVLWMLLGTMIGGASSLYDKVLLQRAGYAPFTVQFWFSVYSVALQSAILLARRPKGFVWRWTIPLVGLFLAVADRLWFQAMHCPDALAGVLSVVRRSSVVVTFALGTFLFRERWSARKALSLAAVLCGLWLLSLG